MLSVSMNAVSGGPVNPEELRASRTMQDAGCLLAQPPRDSAAAWPVDRRARNVTARCLVGCDRRAARRSGCGAAGLRFLPVQGISKRA